MTENTFEDATEELVDIPADHVSDGNSRVILQGPHLATEVLKGADTFLIRSLFRMDQDSEYTIKDTLSLTRDEAKLLVQLLDDLLKQP